MARPMSRRSSLLATTICAVIGTVAAADHASARGGGGGFHGSGGAFHFAGPLHAPVTIRISRGPVYRAGHGAVFKSTVRSGTIKFPPAVSPAAVGAATIKISQIPASPSAPATLHPASPGINVSQIPASPNAPANLGNAPKSTGLKIPQNTTSPNAPAILHPAPVINVSQIPASPNAPVNLGNAPKSTGPVVTIPQSPASPTAPGKVLLPPNPAQPGTGGAAPGGMPAPTPMRRADVNFGPIPSAIGTDVVVEDTCYWIKAKFAVQDGQVVRLVKVCGITDATQP